MSVTAREEKFADVAAPVDVAESVYRALRIAIQDGEVMPGQRLASERSLAADLKAPRAAVRRALQRLSAEGMVERGIGRAGSRVRPNATSPGGIEAPATSPQDVLEARVAFEPGLAPLVIARATEDDFAAMAAQLDRMDTAATQQEFREAGYGFHLLLARATRNPLLVTIFELIIEARARAGWGRLAALNATSEQRSIQIGRNRRVLAALRDRDAPTATALLAEHLRLMLDEVVGGPK